MIAKLPPFRFSVAQYDQMVEVGILSNSDRVELIRGEIVPKMPNNPPHSAVINRINRFLGPQLPGRAILGIQNPIRLSDSEPEPDVSVLRPEPGYYSTRHPGPADVYLLIEASDSSLDRDCDVKAPLYAENAVPEYWVVDVNAGTVLVHRQPRPDGTWADVTTRGRGEALTIAALPGVAFAVADILP